MSAPPWHHPWWSLLRPPCVIRISDATKPWSHLLPFMKGRGSLRERPATCYTRQSFAAINTSPLPYTYSHLVVISDVIQSRSLPGLWHCIKHSSLRIFYYFYYCWHNRDVWAFQSGKGWGLALYHTWTWKWDYWCNWPSIFSYICPLVYARS
jgi:hypothetical protein